MTNLSGLLSIIVVTFLFGSCQDISKFRDNYDKEAVLKSIMTKDDSLSFLSMDSINLGTVKKPRFKYLNVVFANLSKSMTITVYSMKCPTGMELSSKTPLHLTLEPGKSNIDYPLSLNLNTSVVNDGPYEEKIFINESDSRYITVKAMITK